MTGEAVHMMKKIRKVDESVLDYPCIDVDFKGILWVAPENMYGTKKVSNITLWAAPGMPECLLHED